MLWLTTTDSQSVPQPRPVWFLWDGDEILLYSLESPRARNIADHPRVSLNLDGNGLGGDIVITDVVMPDENGLDLIPRIKKLRPNLRVVVMSARNTLLTAVKATERGAFEYLPKPFDVDEALAIVKRAIAAAAELAGEEPT